MDKTVLILYIQIICPPASFLFYTVKNDYINFFWRCSLLCMLPSPFPSPTNPSAPSTVPPPPPPQPSSTTPSSPLPLLLNILSRRPGQNIVVKLCPYMYYPHTGIICHDAGLFMKLCAVHTKDIPWPTNMLTSPMGFFAQGIHVHEKDQTLLVGLSVNHFAGRKSNFVRNFAEKLWIFLGKFSRSCFD
jgi:hypothetical protein